MTDPREDILMQVVERDGKVMLLFSVQAKDDKMVATKTDHMILDPSQAVAAACLITDMAFEADTSLKPVAPTLKAELVQRHREKLIPRIALMMGSLREKKTVTNGQLATQIMDAVCSEVFS